MIRSDHVFQNDTDSKWYFWDETGTAYLGPFDTEQDASTVSSEYAAYLMSGVVSNPAILGILDGVSWRDGEEF